jgi:hypothetical protein
MKKAEPAERENLAMSVGKIPDAEYAVRVAGMLGSRWGSPLKDWQGNLSFLKIEPSNAKAGISTAVLHSEYSLALLSTAPLACRRSSRQEYEIDCAAQLATPTRRTEYEGRGASGRRLVEENTTTAERVKYASSAGFFGQIVEQACSIRGSK